MSKDLLELIKSGCSYSTLELAQKTGTTVEMVMARLERYEALHVIKRVELKVEGCGGHCGHKHCADCSCNKEKKETFAVWEVCR